MMCLQQGPFGGTRRCSGGGETHRWADSGHAVKVTIRVRDVLSNLIAAVRHAVDQDECIPDLALERGREAVSYYCKSSFELIIVHDVLSLGFPHQASALDLGRPSGFEVRLVRLNKA
jgi:hypothetical protein